jgi:hypothetical protein
MIFLVREAAASYSRSECWNTRSVFQPLERMLVCDRHASETLDTYQRYDLDSLRTRSEDH